MSDLITSNTTIQDIKEYLEKPNNEFNDEILNFIIDKSPITEELNSIRTYDGDTPLVYAISREDDDKYLENIRKLIILGIDVNATNELDYNVLEMAIQNTHGKINLDVLDILIEGGINIKHTNHDNENILFFLSNYGGKEQFELIEELINRGVDVNLQNIDGETPLMIAVEGVMNDMADPEIINFLVTKGADISIKNDAGKTAYDILYSREPENPLLSILSTRTEPIIPKPEDYPRIRANISKTVSFEDPIMLSEEEINIGKYIEEDPDNIVIVYNKNKYFFTTRTLINDNLNDAFIFPCGDDYTLNPNNIYETIELYDLKKIGFVYGYPCIIDALYKNIDAQLFALINTDVSFPAFVSDNVLNHGADWVSRLHCQEGQESKISLLKLAYPSVNDNPEDIQMGGNYKSKKNRSKKNKHKKTHKKRNKKKNKKTHKKRNKK